MNIQSSLQINSKECPSVSIVIVNWRTLKQTQLCLRSLRKFTHYTNFECIVVDNDSKDESIRYLSGLPWIKLLRNEHPEPDHRNGLDLGIKNSNSDFVLIMHTDTFVRQHNWLESLLSRIDNDTYMLGTQDRLIRPLPWYLFFDDFYRRTKLEKRWRFKNQIPKIISHCVLFRRELFSKHRQRFDYPAWIDGIYNDTGEFIQRYCEENGLGVKYLRRRDLAPLLWHFEGATLNLTRKGLPFKRRLRAWSFYQRTEIRKILSDQSLDA